MLRLVYKSPLGVLKQVSIVTKLYRGLRGGPERGFCLLRINLRNTQENQVGWEGKLVLQVHPYGWPFAPLGTCEVNRFRTNSRIRFDTASAPVPAKPLKTTNEAPRSEAG